MTVNISGDTGISQVQNNVITADKIASGAVTVADIADGAITSTKLASGLSLSGNVLMPDRPAFRAGKYINSGSVGLIPFDTAAYNIGNHYNTSTYRFTVPVSGTYILGAQIYNDNSTQTGLQIKVNGTGICEVFHTRGIDSSYYVSNETCIVAYLNVNDYVEAWAVSATYHCNASYSYFLGALIG